MNKVIVLGRLGQDPELRKTQTDKSVCNLSIATTERVKDEEKTMWHRVVVWEKTAENCAKYLTKGRQVLVEGRLASKDWEKDGVTHQGYEIVAERVEFVGDGKKNVETVTTDVKVDF
jgi:single-strand DNA-binding protein